MIDVWGLGLAVVGLVGPVTCLLLHYEFPIGLPLLVSLLSLLWQRIWMYIHHHIVALWILVPLIGGGVRCVLFWHLLKVRGYDGVVTCGLHEKGFHLVG